MTLSRAILALYPQIDRLGSDFGTTDDGRISNWNEQKLGPRPREADVIAAAERLPVKPFVTPLTDDEIKAIRALLAGSRKL
jgi:hypothetical protein